MPTFRRYFTGSSVSRDLDPGERSWDAVVFQSGRPVLDAELNLPQSASDYNRSVLATKGMPSGFVRTQSAQSSLEDFGFPTPAPGDANEFYLRSQLAVVAGMPVVVDLTADTSGGINVIALPAPTAHSSPADVRRTDFVFLEVWRALVSPSPRASGTITINDPQTIVAGETVTINATGAGGPSVTFTARAVPAAPTEFLVGGSPAATASSLVSAINNVANGLYPNYVLARNNGTNAVTVAATFGGTTGNTITLATSAPTHVTLSGGTLTGGANTGNKPTQNSLYRQGNVLSLTGSNITEDLIDPALNVETARRIQVQYRIRVYSSQASGVNPKTQPDGFSNTGILAQGATGAPVALYPFVPADKTTVTSNSSAVGYGFEDPGLWIAGSGNSASATALGTVDGFVYAIPIAMVFRRSDATGTGGFDPFNNAQGALPIAHANNFPNTNLPGGPYLIPTGESDRPDGLFADIIVPSDLLDLRRHISLTGFDAETEMRAQLQSLMDGTLQTWMGDASDITMIGNGTGGMSPTPLLCEEVGREAGNGGVAPSSGDTTVGSTVRNFDHVARRFASQSVVERVVFEIPVTGPYPTGISVVKSGVTTKWHEDDAITIDFGDLNPTTLQTWLTPAVPAVGVTAFWPSGTMVTDVLTSYHDDGHSTTPVSQVVVPKRIEGIGTPQIKVVLDGNLVVVNGGGAVGDRPMVDVGASDTGSVRRIFLELEVTYPTGYGLSRTPTGTPPEPTGATTYPGYDIGGPLVENDRTQRPPEMRSAWVPKPRFRNGFREVTLEQVSAPAGTFISDSLVTRNGNTVYPPRRVWSVTGLTANGGAAIAAYGSSSRLVTLTGAPVANQTLVPITYYSQDPVPNAGASGYQVGVYYNTHAPQTAGTQSGGVPLTLLPTELAVEPLCVSGTMVSGQTGKGSNDLPYPYINPMDQIATATDPPVGTSPKEWYFSATAEVSLADFSATTGFLTLHNFVPVDGTNTLTLGSTTAGRGTEIDPEGRVYYDYVNHNGYKPASMASPLLGVTRHKNFSAMLVRTMVDTRLFRKGDVLLVVLSRFADLDQRNNFAFTDTPNIRTGAAIYRAKNLPLLPPPPTV